MPNCPKCGKEVRPGWVFCKGCGLRLPAPVPEPETSLADQTSGAILVRRIDSGEMQGLLNKTVVVEEGQSAVLLVEGRHDVTFGPGKHNIGNVMSARARDAAVVVFQTSDIPLTVSVPRLLTSDPLPLSLDFSLVLKIEEPMGFFRNLVLSQPNCWQDRDGEA